VGAAPLRALALGVALTVALALPSAAAAQKKGKRKKAKPAPAATKNDGKSNKPKKPKKPPKLDFSGMNLEGRLRTPQLIYFLERASAELQAASLERRSFIPEMVRSLDEEAL
jgi:hypothetical protein